MTPEQTLMNMLDLLDKPRFMPVLLDWLASEGYEVSKQTPDPPAFVAYGPHKDQQEFDWITAGPPDG